MNAISTTAELKFFEEDFEWYPTTNEIIQAFHTHASAYNPNSLLDVGAGNGKVLIEYENLNKALNEEIENDKYKSRNRRYTNLFAIEKSDILLSSLPANIGVLGTNFWDQSLLDKKVSCIFSNPPYKQFKEWAVKLIYEANANYIYLVIPQRWKNSHEILDAIKFRKAYSHEVIGEFDFTDSEDRSARAKVDLLFIALRKPSEDDRWGRTDYVEPDTDPFDLWVKQHFEIKSPDVKKESFDDRFNKAKENTLVPGGDVIKALCALYKEDMNELLENYKKVCSLDPVLLKEVGVDIKSVINSLKFKVDGLKNLYWRKLFDNYHPITSRIIASNRKKLLDKLTEKTNIDFTEANCYATTMWVIKNANINYDSQLVSVFDKMLDKANIIKYKSNERVFKWDQYRYAKREEGFSHYSLDYRIVIERVGGYSSSCYSSDAINGLNVSAYDFLADIFIVMDNLGFESITQLKDVKFKPGAKVEFLALDKKKGTELTLLAVRAYKNGNLHIQFHQKAMLAMNVEVGRLLGWIHSPKQAAEELNEDEVLVNEVFKANFTAITSTLNNLLLS